MLLIRDVYGSCDSEGSGALGSDSCTGPFHSRSGDLQKKIENHSSSKIRSGIFVPFPSFLVFFHQVPSGNLTYGKSPFIVSFPMKNGGSFHSYVKLPEGKCRFSRGTSPGDWP